MESNPDIKNSKTNPLIHYLRFGKQEKRRPVQDTTDENGIDKFLLTKQNQNSLETNLEDEKNKQVNKDDNELTSQQLISENEKTQNSLSIVHDNDLVYGLDTTIPDSIIIGKGNCLLIKGFCFCPNQKIHKMDFLVGKKVFKIENSSIYRVDVLSAYLNYYQDQISMLHSGFWGVITFDEINHDVNQDIFLSVTLTNKKVITKKIGKTSLIPIRETFRIMESIPLSNKEPKVAICLTTYNPSIELFKTQIQSLINQIHKNWICIINDDHSSFNTYKQIQAIASVDNRLIVFRNEKRQGHYYNFETALTRVPDNIDFVAFCDQDDEWYPDKISKSLAAFKSEEDMLVYCDMNVVDKNGKIISDTFWFNRKNNFTSLQTLLYANTVTGAASIFRANLLKEILPFPEKIGDAYYDHWVACVALTKGKIQYVNESLYAYYQHGNNAYGIQPFIASYRLFPEISQFLRQIKHPTILAYEIKVFLENLDNSYYVYLLRLITLTKILLIRITPIEYKKKKILKQLCSSEKSVFGLIIHSISYLVSRSASLGYELLAIRSFLGHKFYSLIFKLFKKRKIFQLKSLNVNQFGQTSQTINPKGNQIANKIIDDGKVNLLKRMIAPLSLNIIENEPKRVNFLMATVDFKYVFGGYLAMFTLAKKIKIGGKKVRIIIVEPCDFKPDEWRKQIVAYPGLEDLFELVELSYHFDRTIPLSVNPDDIFLATSCWTAHIASQAVKTLGKEKFIFFAQEYEPIFFPMSSMQALSQQSYYLPQYTIFSTDLLRQYFQSHHIGVYKNDAATGNLNSIVINNAIYSFNISIEDISERKRKKFLFYARPENHAARNLYELGLLGIEKAIEKGAFSDQWDFYGIGTIGNNRQVSLGCGVNMTLLPKVSLKEYLALMPTFDLGMSLMLSPHPSLVPLEMAAAGMPTITNSYENKTPPELNKISKNIIGIEPTIDGISNGLIEGVKQVNNYSERIKNSQINWPTSWDDVFNISFHKALDEMMRNC